MTNNTRPSFYRGSTTRQVFPVWRSSTRRDVASSPLSKRAAVKIFHDARRFERETRRRIKNRQDGAIGRNGLAILHAMLFDCIDYASGKLDPGYNALARFANISVRSVARGLAKLKAAGVLDWVRRCHWDDESGRLEQDTNAYAIAAPAKWNGYTAPPPPPPAAGTWGDHPPQPDGLAAAAEALKSGDRRAAQRALELEPADTLAGALARLGKHPRA